MASIVLPASDRPVPAKDTPGTLSLVLAGLVAFAATLALMVAIPHREVVRWQAVRTEAYARLGWAYSRIHDDATPIDIALIGTSHTMNGIDGLAVARAMAAAGLREPGGRCLTVTNFAIPNYGRNLHYLLARELLDHRRPRAIVLEVVENETRKAHPLFSHVATTRDLVTAPVAGNTGYLADLIRLPYRQVALGVESLAPDSFGLHPRFNPGRYDGSTVDNTRVVTVDGKALTPPLDRALDPGQLDRAAAGLRAAKRLHYLPPSLAGIEYAMPRRYVAALLDLAQQRGVPVYLLYLPGYGQPPAPYDLSLYRGLPMLTVAPALAPRAHWHDVHHLNADGAAAASALLAGQLTQALRRDGLARQTPSAASGACDFGYPQRPVTVPFKPGNRTNSEVEA